MGTLTWKRPSGSTVESNDLPDTVAKCEELGWELADAYQEELDLDNEDEEDTEDED